jgi:predicted membrane protein
MSRIRSHQGSIFWGFLIIIFGVIFLLGSLGRLDTRHIFSRFWPVILIAFGLWHMISNGFRNIFPGILLLVIGAVFLGQSLNSFPPNIWIYVWPLAIIFVGLWLMVGPRIRRPGFSGPPIEADELDLTAILGGLKRVIDSASFKGGRATAIMGGLEIDFRQAGLDKGQASLELTAIMGGIDIKVPPDWRVVIHGMPILGAVESKAASVPESQVKATLHVRATAIMGGIEIKN